VNRLLGSADDAEYPSIPSTDFLVHPNASRSAIEIEAEENAAVATCPFEQLDVVVLPSEFGDFSLVDNVES
jgi:hypothetical protein